MNKITRLEDIRHLFKDGITLLFGGFLGCGSPHKIIDFIIESKIKDLTIIGNDTSYPDYGIGRLVANGQVKKIITSHIGTNPETGRLMNEGVVEVELVPQGTLVERIRAGGAGLGAVITPTGVGTILEEKREKITIAGKDYLIELPIKADLAILKGSIVDEFGNTFYKGTTRNFNPVMATAANKVIMEAETLVPIGDLEADITHTPGVLIDYIVGGI